ncbi:hypothetical protein [Nannocystis sp.]|uniref:hypothetical protein n=1 Tax=Nannocystis sp. TaxID=1962667 RepID=UPI0025E18B7D|nr:hypothetical protein [Nannocystis sp.]MBK7828652.1 hypothetical protein [Nannocystis sp.]
MTPHLLPVRVSACVYDPSTVPLTGEVVVDGVTKKKPHDWSFRQPNYDGVVKELLPVWDGLFETRQLPPAIAGATGPAICLSWALPAGWGQPLRADDPHSHPRLPDRWLVVRMARRTHTGQAWAAADDEPDVRAWVVDSGVADASGAPVLVHEAGALAVRRVGRVRTLEQAVAAKPDESRERLTAEGAAASRDLTFTAFVPAHLNNLACVDRLNDLPAGLALEDTALSYLVVGWYREPGVDDPITTLQGGGVADIRRALGLYEPGDGKKKKASDTLSLPLGERCVFHGMVAYVDYFNPRSYLGPAFGAPHPSEHPRKHPCESLIYPDRTQIGVGMTGEQALAELCANRDDSTKDGSGAQMAAVLEALLDGTLARWDAVGAEDVKAHARRLATFQTVSSGKEWSVGPADPAAAPKDMPPLGAALTKLLADLNAAQAQADRKSWVVASAVEALYTSFWMAQKVGSEVDGLPAYVAAQAAETRALQAEHQKLVAAAAAQEKGLSTALDAALVAGELPVKFTTFAHEAAPFYVPKEPAVAVRNVSPRLPLRPLPRVGRSTDQIVVDAPRDGQGFQYARLACASVVAKLKSGLGDPVLDAVLSLLADEASIVEEAVAALVRARSVVPAFHAKSNLSEWVDRGRRLFADLGGAAVWADPRSRPPTLDGSSLIHLPTVDGPTVPLADLCTLWVQQPWLPLFLDWEVDWIVGDDSASQLAGRTLLANRPQRVFKDCLDRLDKAVMEHDAAVHTILSSDAFAAIGQWDVVGQTLSGIHQQLLTRHDSLPRIAPERATLAGQCFDGSSGAALGPPQCSPNTPFQWFRRGSLRIRELRVVDLFGQALVLTTTAVSAAQKSQADVVPLDDRVLEPTRLVVTQPEILGWIVASRLDHAVVVYDRDGGPLGMIVREAGAAKLQPLPAATGEPIKDPGLRAFVTALTGAAAFDRFMALADEALARTQPARSEANPAPAALTGRPLALVRADVQIERRGGPVHDASWLANTYNFKQFMAGGAAFIAGERSPLRSVSVKIGSQHLPDDGLIAYQEQAGPIERTLKLASDAKALTMDLPGAEQPAAKAVSFLIDPHGKLYLDPGVLPVTAFSLPPDMYEEVLARLPAVIRVDPVLVDSNADLRAMLGADAAKRPHMDLPIPVGVRTPDARERAADGTGKPARPPALFFLGGVPVEVDPAGPIPPVPSGEIAAAAGMLILGSTPTARTISP